MKPVNLKKKIGLKKPYLITAWPGMGDVSFRAVNYLIEKLPCVEFASFNAKEFFYPTASFVQGGILELSSLPFNKFYYYKNKTGKNDLLIFLSNAQPDLAFAQKYSQMILRFAKSFEVEGVISFASLPSAIDHTQQPSVYFAATDMQMSARLKKLGLTVLSEGTISGMNGLFLGLAKEDKLKGFCLLAEIPLYAIQIDNPKASYALLKVLAQFLNLEINLDELLEQARLMETEINHFLEYLKLGGQPPGPIGEEDIERIKHSLSQLTKLPLSVKQRIEELFALSKNDLSKAEELKAELDKWNVYKEYEDRFLDLFKDKKSEEKNN